MENKENFDLSPEKFEMDTSANMSDDENEGMSIQEIRERNKQKLAEMFKNFRDPELERNIFKPDLIKPEKPKIQRKKRDEVVRYNVKIPLEVRKSSRLQNKIPTYTEDELDNIQENVRRVFFKRPGINVNDYIRMDGVVSTPSPTRSQRRPINRTPRKITPVEDVTQEMLDNIATRMTNKKYSQSGTTCHQCRQKTEDQKTCCRNPDCIGIRGIFCGPCIKIRYGEDCAEALLNPNWFCPVCRGKCNCSICRTKNGKRPTGILAPIALSQGYDSVDHFLKHLNGQGDIPEEDDKWQLMQLAQDCDALLGFSDSGRKFNFSDSTSEYKYCRICVQRESKDPSNLLGFSKNGKIAVVGGNKTEFLLQLGN